LNFQHPADLIDEISDKEVDETSAKDGGSKTKIGPLVPKLKKEEAGAGGGKEKEKEKDRKGSVEKGPEEGGEDEEKGLKLLQAPSYVGIWNVVTF
jgi:hypothetical protein